MQIRSKIQMARIELFVKVVFGQRHEVGYAVIEGGMTQGEE